MNETLVEGTPKRKQKDDSEASKQGRKDKKEGRKEDSKERKKGRKEERKKGRKEEGRKEERIKTTHEVIIGSYLLVADMLGSKIEWNGCKASKALLEQKGAKHRLEGSDKNIET